MLANAEGIPFWIPYKAHIICLLWDQRQEEIINFISLALNQLLSSQTPN